VQGFSTKTEKRTEILDSFKSTTDVAILTETKILASEKSVIENEWDGWSHHSHHPGPSPQAGVTILLKRGISATPTDWNKSEIVAGRICWVLLDIGGRAVLIIGVYAPSHGEQPEFHEKLFEILNTVHYVHFVKYDDAVSFYDAVSDTIRRRGGNRGIFTEEGVDTVAYFGGNHGSRV